MGWNKVAVIGAGMTEFGELFDAGLEQLSADAFFSAVESVDYGLPLELIDAAYFGNVMGSLQGNEIPSGATLANAIGLPGIAATRIENGCPTGSDAFRQGCLAVAAGTAEVVALRLKQIGHESAFYWYVATMFAISFVTAVGLTTAQSAGSGRSSTRRIRHPDG